jgi:hypothetical protein
VGFTTSSPVVPSAAIREFNRVTTSSPLIASPHFLPFVTQTRRSLIFRPLNWFVFKRWVLIDLRFLALSHSAPLFNFFDAGAIGG